MELVDEVRANLGDSWVDEGELVDAASEVLEQTSELIESIADETGPIVVYLPLQLSPHEERFIKTLADRIRVTVLVGTTGDNAADESARDILALPGGTAGALSGTAGTSLIKENLRSVQGWSARPLPMSRCAWSCGT